MLQEEDTEAVPPFSHSRGQRKNNKRNKKRVLCLAHVQKGDRNYVIGGLANSTVKIWAFVGIEGFCVNVQRVKSPVRCIVEFSGYWILFGHEHGEITKFKMHDLDIYDADFFEYDYPSPTRNRFTMFEKNQRHNGPVRCLVEGPVTSEVLSAGSDGCIKIWHVYSGVCVRHFQNVRATAVDSLVLLSTKPNAFKYDIYASSPFVLVGGSRDGLLRLWYYDKYDCMKSIRPTRKHYHARAKTRLVASKDGSMLLYVEGDCIAMRKTLTE